MGRQATNIEARIAEIISQHAYIEHRMECACGDHGELPDWTYDAEHAAHVAQVLTTELGLTEETPEQRRQIRSILGYKDQA